MGKRSDIFEVAVSLALAFLVAGCELPFLARQPIPTAAPGAIEAIVVETANAAYTQTAQNVQPTVLFTPTQTPRLTYTPTVTYIPTALFVYQSPTPAPIPVFPPSGGGSGSSSGPLSCSVIAQKPANGTEFKPRRKFEMVWTIRNTGSSNWELHTIDYLFLEGHRFHDKPRYDLEKGVKPNEKVNVIVTMYAPKQAGSYSADWGLVLGPDVFCKFSISVVVK